MSEMPKWYLLELVVLWIRYDNL